MFNFFKRLFGTKKTHETYETVKPQEPEFLNEYWVYIGTRDCTTVYARSTQEAREKVLCDMRNDVPYYDSRYYTRSNPGKKEDYRTTLRGEVYAIFKRTSSVRNPAYTG